jgi:hypothetical protein
VNDDLKKVRLFEELRNLCQGLEDTLSDATLIINRQEDRIEELEAKLAVAVEALAWCSIYENSERATATLAELKGEQT